MESKIIFFLYQHCIIDNYLSFLSQDSYNMKFIVSILIVFDS